MTRIQIWASPRSLRNGSLILTQTCSLPLSQVQAQIITRSLIMVTPSAFSPRVKVYGWNQSGDCYETTFRAQWGDSAGTQQDEHPSAIFMGLARARIWYPPSCIKWAAEHIVVLVILTSCCPDMSDVFLSITRKWCWIMSTFNYVTEPNRSTHLWR